MRTDRAEEAGARVPPDHGKDRGGEDRGAGGEEAVRKSIVIFKLISSTNIERIPLLTFFEYPQQRPVVVPGGRAGRRAALNGGVAWGGADPGGPHVGATVRGINTV